MNGHARFVSQSANASHFISECYREGTARNRQAHLATRHSYVQVMR